MNDSSREEASDEIRREQARHRVAVGGHEVLVREISAALYRFDPIGAAFGDNPDEYDFEAEIIRENIFGGATGAAAVQALVHQVLVDQFDADLAGAPEDHADLAVEIWELWEAAEGAGSGGS